MRRAWLRIVVNFIILLMLAATLTQLAGCAGTPKQMEPMLSYEQLAGMITVTHREFITLRTGQICEVKNAKIVACERNPGRYAETKQDIRQIVEKEEDED